MRRAITIVCDSLGVGELPDAVDPADLHGPLKPFEQIAVAIFNRLFTFVFCTLSDELLTLGEGIEKKVSDFAAEVAEAAGLQPA